MLADYYTKALQGKLFHKFRNVIMGYENISTLMNLINSTFEERVGKNREMANAENKEISKETKMVTSADDVRTKKVCTG